MGGIKRFKERISIRFLDVDSHLLDPDGLQTLQVEGEEEETVRNARKRIESTRDSPIPDPETLYRVAQG
ncbi:hypothetical protein ASPSYDRAFT_39830 [Aspergillus sydowii CBS 593.65]|uniref:Uncharacterized protein n=1 Tax=Aspergillus sydowii CBS 593.65 TaxID=1036612 RepID=A0A1L9U013_9EURO|nr:uncharacterized protein ASPSYDRAFT_39830 [Aspergillus sydowii CBS 593.65]OJJ65040.1 hypothetical protein ASPSYDRAFT_39830 [Aspergillus sydowii CBS 593.65]